MKKIGKEEGDIKEYLVKVDNEREKKEVMKKYVRNVKERIMGIKGKKENIEEMVK